MLKSLLYLSGVVATSGIATVAYRWFKNNVTITQQASPLVLAMLDNHENTTDFEFVDDEYVPRVVWYYALLARAEFDLLPKTDANKRVIQRFIRDKMRDKCTREVDIAKYCPMAVARYFLAMPMDKDVQLMYNSDQSRISERDMVAKPGLMATWWHQAPVMRFKSE